MRFQKATMAGARVISPKLRQSHDWASVRAAFADTLNVSGLMDRRGCCTSGRAKYPSSRANGVEVDHFVQLYKSSFAGWNETPSVSSRNRSPTEVAGVSLLTSISENRQPGRLVKANKLNAKNDEPYTPAGSARKIRGRPPLLPFCRAVRAFTSLVLLPLRAAISLAAISISGWLADTNPAMDMCRSRASRQSALPPKPSSKALSSLSWSDPSSG